MDAICKGEVVTCDPKDLTPMRTKTVSKSFKREVKSKAYADVELIT